jgi:ribonuclease D
VLLIDAADVAAVAAACRAAGEVAFDLEFVSEGRMRAELGLVQVAWQVGDTVEVRAIDAVAVDPRPVLELLCGEVSVIAHAARQDLQILASRFGLKGARLFDTQVASAFVGMGDQVGYGRLIEVLIGEKVAKDVQFTDWLKRPLTPRQLDYALDDVRHLPRAAAMLRAQLADHGRADWVAAECAALCEVSFAAGQAGPELAWRDVSGARKLRGAERATLTRLAAWRWRTALARNKPPTWVLADRVLVDLAQRRPRDEAELAKVRGAGEVARTHAAEVLAELSAIGDIPAELHAPPAGSPRAQLWEEVFVALVQLAAERTKIPPRWIAARGDCEELARLLDRDDPRANDHPLLSTWRSDVVGATLHGWVRGEVSLAGDRSQPSGVKLIRSSRPSRE